MMILEPLFFIGVLILLVASIKEYPEIFRLQTTSAIKGIFFLLGFSFIGFLFHKYIVGALFPEWYSFVKGSIKLFGLSIRPMDMMRVFWEDIVFVAPSLILYAKGHKKLSWLVLIASTPAFVLGHTYQGAIGLVTVVYPFISRYLSIRYGFITMLIWHIAYDLSVLIRMALIGSF